MLATQHPITLTYFARHKWHVFGGMGAGLAMVLVLHDFSQQHSSVPSIWLVLLVLCCPFGLRTAQGRAWWLAYLCMLAGSVGVYYFGTHSLFGILCAIVVVAASGFGICLRWNAP